MKTKTAPPEYPDRMLIDQFGPEWILETDSQDVEAAAEYLSPAARAIMEQESIAGLFVLLDSSGADYAAIYGFYGSVPFTWKTAWRLYPCELDAVQGESDHANA